mmetsp:Transcript_167627/g.538380  ORF Transcript_167627/g.538380 Transcript_167627/m.538380 type:complete len:203 (+) Transcript_167627:85-693(+)
MADVARLQEEVIDHLTELRIVKSELIEQRQECCRLREERLQENAPRLKDRDAVQHALVCEHTRSAKLRKSTSSLNRRLVSVAANAVSARRGHRPSTLSISPVKACAQLEVIVAERPSCNLPTDDELAFAFHKIVLSEVGGDNVFTLGSCMTGHGCSHVVGEGHMGSLAFAKFPRSLPYHMSAARPGHTMTSSWPCHCRIGVM